MSGPGARFSASVAVMNSASDVRSTMLAAPQLNQRLAGHSMHGPLIHLHRAETLVEVDRADVPVQHRPFQPAAAPLQRRARQVAQQLFAATLAAKLLPHVQILEVDAGLGEERGEVGEEQCEARNLVANPRDHDLCSRALAEQLLAELLFGGLAFVEEAL